MLYGYSRLASRVEVNECMCLKWFYSCKLLLRRSSTFFTTSMCALVKLATLPLVFLVDVFYQLKSFTTPIASLGILHQLSLNLLLHSHYCFIACLYILTFHHIYQLSLKSYSGIRNVHHISSHLSTFH